MIIFTFALIKSSIWMKSFAFLAFVYFIFNCLSTSAQGCSDAGACSVGSLGILPFKFEPLPTDKTKLTKIDVSDPQLALKRNTKENTSLVSSSDSIALVNSEYKTLKYNVQLTAYYGAGHSLHLFILLN